MAATVALSTPALWLRGQRRNSLRRPRIARTRACSSDDGAAAASTTVEVAKPRSVVEVEMTKAMAQTCLRIAPVLSYAPGSEDNSETAMVVSYVMPNSPVEKAGITPGQELIRVNDADVPPDASVKYVSQLLLFGYGDPIRLLLSEDPVLPPDILAERLRLMNGGGDPDPLVARLEQSRVKQRINRRKERLEVDAQRDDRPFFVGVGLTFLVPPLVILFIAQKAQWIPKGLLF